MGCACVDVITELVDRHASTGHCDVVADIATSYPGTNHLRTARPREDWRLFSDWAVDVRKAFGVNVAEHELAILRTWASLEDYVEDLIAARRRSLTDDLIRAEVDRDRLTRDELSTSP
jgi:cytochrome P450